MPNNKIISNQNTARKKLKEKIISTRISDIEYLALKKRAKDAGMSLSSFARSSLLSAKVVQRIGKCKWLPFDAFLSFQKLKDRLNYILTNIGNKYVINFY